MTNKRSFGLLGGRGLLLAGGIAAVVLLTSSLAAFGDSTAVSTFSKTGTDATTTRPHVAAARRTTPRPGTRSTGFSATRTTRA